MSSPQANKNDSDLWLALGSKLKQSFGISGDQQLWLAPMNAAGIAAGIGIPAEILNQGVKNVGDALLDPTNPIFTPNAGSYYDRVAGYMNNVTMGGDAGGGAQKAYDLASAQLQKSTEEFAKTKLAAFQAYNEFKTLGGFGTFFEWIANNGYPDYGTKEAQMTTDATNVYAALKVIGGTNGTLITTALQRLQSASNGSAPAGNYNMACCSLQATDISNKNYPNPLPIAYLPTYSIAANYASDVNSWISNFAKLVDKPRYSFDLNVKDGQQSDWSQLGFKDTKINVEGSYAVFFKASYTQENQEKTEEVHAASSSSEISVTVTATDMGSYPITTGGWDVKNLRQFPLRDDASPELSKQAYKVSYAILAYGVGMQISLKGETQKKVQGAIEKANKYGGKVSFFGFDIGAGGSADYTNTSTTTWSDFENHDSSANITIKPQNNGYPTLLGIIGTPIFPAVAS